jgi:hypothetical protein
MASVRSRGGSVVIGAVGRSEDGGRITIPRALVLRLTLLDTTTSGTRWSYLLRPPLNTDMASPDRDRRGHCISRHIRRPPIKPLFRKDNRETCGPKTASTLTQQMRMGKQIMRIEPLHTQTDDDQRYNGANDSGHARMPETGKLDVSIPAHLPEFGAGAARALLHLILEAHRRQTMNSQQSAEDM